MASVQLRNVTKAWGDVVVSKDINLDIHEGEFVVFVGPSGCGKSTLLRMIAGLETITSGEMCIRDRTIPSLAPAQLFCMAISTALKALDTTDETFIAQLLEAPSQIMPVISLTILIIAVLMVLMSRVNSHAIPAAAPIAAVEAAHSADKRV